MTEKEKMLHGMLYDGNDAQLVQDRNTAKDLCYEFNHLRPSDVKGQEKLLKNLLGEIHGDFSVMAPFYCDYGYNIEIGEHFFANHNTVILCQGDLWQICIYCTKLRILYGRSSH